MSWTATLRMLPVLGFTASLLALGACSEDKGSATDDGEPADEPNDQPNDQRDAAGPTPDGGKPSTSMDAGLRLDATVVPTPTEDGGALSDATRPVPPVLAGDASVEPTVDGGAPPVSLQPLPDNGQKLSTCYGQADCKGDDLTCVGARGVFGAGFCSDDCAQDSDCPAIDGLAASCSLQGQCRISCAGEANDGEGPCPDNMECQNVVPVGVPALPVYECRYPVGAGSKKQKSFDKCDAGHGSGDCEGLLSCHVPFGFGGAPIGPGYCTQGCESATDCAVPAGVVAVATCELGGCELDCSQPGGSCPAGMNCRDVDAAPIVNEFRCRFVDF